MRRLRPRLLAAAVALAGILAGCRSGEPCRQLADRDCARHGEQSPLCQDSRQRAATADPYLVEVCRRELEREP